MKLVLSVLILIKGISLFGQFDFKSLSTEQSVESFSVLETFPEIKDYDLIFYGFLHGAEIPQKIDCRILKELIDEGFCNYAPEISYVQAFFMNKFLATGNNTLLKYVLQTYRAPQDASLQWIDKFQIIYHYLQDQNKEFQIIGTDREDSAELIITFLSHLLGERETGNPAVDSLHLFKDLEPDLTLISMGPLFKMASKIYNEGGDVDALLYSNDSQNQYSKRFIEYYYKDKSKFHKYFGDDSLKVIRVFDSFNHDKNRIKREETIIKNFERDIIPLIDKGHKVYSNFGYAHVLQSKLNGSSYLAAELKSRHPNLKIFTLLSHMKDSEVLIDRKLCKSDKIKRQGKKLKTAKVCGAINSKEDDGDSENEKVKGIKELNAVTGQGKIRTILISELPEELTSNLYFLDYEIGKNSSRMEFSSILNTQDYYQGLIFIKGSRPNIPYEMTDIKIR